MKIAICGNLNLGLQIKNILKNTDIEVAAFMASGAATQGGGYRKSSYNFICKI